MVDIKTTTNSIEQHLREAYEKIAEKNGTLPEHKNTQNLAEAIRSMPAKPGYDPEHPTLNGLKEFINRGGIIPAGTEIPDIWNGGDNPLIAVHYLDGSSDQYKDSNGENAVGTLLMRKYTGTTTQSGVDYATSAAKSYLDNFYLEASSDELKAIISDISVPVYNGTTMAQVSGKWFLMSPYEMCSWTSWSDETSHNEGVMFQYWKDKTGLTTPSEPFSANDGRKITEKNGNSANAWLRSRYSDNKNVWLIRGSDGSTQYADPTTVWYHVTPVCFIAKESK